MYFFLIYDNVAETKLPTFGFTGNAINFDFFKLITLYLYFTFFFLEFTKFYFFPKRFLIYLCLATNVLIVYIRSEWKSYYILYIWNFVKINHLTGIMLQDNAFKLTTISQTCMHFSKGYFRNLFCVSLYIITTRKNELSSALSVII